jgi:transcription elongation factor Elf1
MERLASSKRQSYAIEPESRCPHCAKRADSPMLVTTQVLYYHCGVCGKTWSVDKVVANPRQP